MRARAVAAIVVLGVAGLIGIAATGGGPEPSVTALGALIVETRGPIVGTVPMVDYDEQYEIDVTYYLNVVVPEQRAVEAFLAAKEAERIEHDRQAALAAAAAPVRSAGYTNPGPNLGSCAGDVECFLACTIAHESASAGVYNAVSPGGTYRGAYQFDQATWDNAVANAGYPQYVGTPPNLAPPNVQDAAAAWLYSVAGNRPWGGRC